MWSTVWFSFTFFELYAYFMIYSFLGWAMESTYVSINAKKWVNRGFINGPFCPIYGTGGTWHSTYFRIRFCCCFWAAL